MMTTARGVARTLSCIEEAQRRTRARRDQFPHAERLLRQAFDFTRAHAPRRLSGCLMLAVWLAVVVGFWNLVA